jgi:tetrahydromethanopterin S-methyltransferase subunit B
LLLRGNTDELVAELRSTVADLRRRLDDSETERRVTQEKLTLFLTHQPQEIEQNEGIPQKVNFGVWIALGIACISAVIAIMFLNR